MLILHHIHQSAGARALYQHQETKLYQNNFKSNENILRYGDIYTYKGCIKGPLVLEQSPSCLGRWYSQKDKAML